MKDLGKVNSIQIVELWKNISVGLLTVILVIVASTLLPFYFSPIIGLVGAAFLFSILYANKIRRSSNCLLVPYAIFFTLIVYSFLSILVNVIYIWGWLHIPDEFVFFNDPYIPTLWMNPIAFFTLLVIYMRRKRLQICIDCRIQNGTHTERGVYGSIIKTESDFQLKNLLIIAAILTFAVWAYYLIEYQAINTNPRDRYIFFWVTVIVLFLDIIYYLYRYYNLFLDLKENDELLTPEEIRETSGKTYLRYYVICNNHLYLTINDGDASNPYHRGVDTPFFTSRLSSQVTTPEAKDIIRNMTGDDKGELRFFYGRRTPDIAKHKVLRFFYFLDGNPEDHLNMPTPGEWVDFEELKGIYSIHPEALSTMTMNDISRLATIMVTEKTYKENGQRKLKLKRYQPVFNLYDVRNSELDFHDDKWMRVAVFNSDHKLFRFRSWLRRLINGENSKTRISRR